MGMVLSERHISQKKKRLQTEIYKHYSKFQRNNKTDEERKQRVIVLWYAFSTKCGIRRDFHTLFT